MLIEANGIQINCELSGQKAGAGGGVEPLPGLQHGDVASAA